jgi:hypothetical protein
LYNNISKLFILSNPYPTLDCNLSFFDLVGAMLVDVF